jgi:hypothetical protein
MLRFLELADRERIPQQITQQAAAVVDLLADGSQM